MPDVSQDATRWVVGEYPEPVLIPKERYTAKGFAALEYQKLWPHVWQMACREEEIPNAGDFIEYEIGDQSVLVVRNPDGAIKAFHNVCLHRGRRLKQGLGNAGEIKCAYHCWTWKLNGAIKDVPDAHTFHPASVVPGELSLREVLVGTWAGFIYINFDLDAEPLTDFLGDLPAIYAGGLPEDMKTVYIRTTVIDANWKVALEAFAESYHVQGTHNQMLTYFDDTPHEGGLSITGLHGCLSQAGAFEDYERGTASPRLGDRMRADARESLYHQVRELEQAQVMFTEGDLAIAEAIRTEELPQGVDPQVVFAERIIDEMVRDGITIPPKPGTDDYLIFPNLIGPQSLRAWILFRARPYGNDPDRCIFEMYHLRRFPEGQGPKEIVRETFSPAMTGDDAVDIERYGIITWQDLTNVPLVQKGLHSKALPGCRPGMFQEGVIRNFHRAIDTYLAR